MNLRPGVLRFTKMQGVGNDFVVVDARDLPETDWAGMAPELCDRRLGIGSDGLLVIDRSGIADIAMRMFNPDGTPDFCGNGIRCVARHAVESDPARCRYLEAQGDATIGIATLTGVRTCLVRRENGGKVIVSVQMALPRFAPHEAPARIPGPEVRNYPLEVGGETIRIDTLSTGTTHTVVLREALPGDEEFLRLSPRIENHPVFPNRTSVLWTRVASRERIELRIWERGAGETWGCGTGACAAAVAARRRGLLGQRVEVASHGGVLEVEYAEGERLVLTGPAERVFEGEYELDE